MGRGGWDPDGDALLRLVEAAGTDDGTTCSLTEQDVAAAGRAAFVWRTVDAELRHLLDPVTTGARTSTERSRED
jgi:hypothetical protein